MKRLDISGIMPWRLGSPMKIRYFLILFAISIAGLSLITMIAWNMLRAEHVNLISRAETRELSTHAGEIHGKLVGLLADLHYLQNSREIIEYLNEPTAEHLDFAGEELLDIGKSRSNYDQIRYLNLNGMEIIKIALEDGKSKVSSPAALEDRSASPYFNEAISIGLDDVYLSRMDLSAERGVAEQPFKPIIRIATPLSDSQGVRRGLLVINYLADGILGPLREERAQSKYLMLNDHSYYLLGDPAKEWAFMLPGETAGEQARFATDYPAVWAEVQTLKAGAVDSSHGLFVYNTIDPHQVYCPKNMHVSTGVRDQALQDSHWHLISFIPHQQLNTLLAGSLRAVVTGYIFLIFCSGLICVLVAHQMEQTRLAVEKNKASEERFRRLSELANEAIYFIEGKTITDCNSMAAKMMGYTQAELIGKSILDLVPKEKQAEISTRISRHMEGVFEDIGLRNDNSTFPIGVNARYIPFQGHEVRVALVQDLTIQKENEQLALQKKELEAIQITTATHAHEINNPLTGINGVLQILSEEDLQTESHDMVEEAIEAVNRIRDVILKMEKMQISQHRPYVGGKQILDLRDDEKSPVKS